MFGDPLYIAVILVGVVLSGITSMMVKSSFARGEKVGLSRGYTGRDVAEAILRSAGIRDVRVVEHRGFLSEALPGFRGDSSINTWLWRIATNEALSFLRKQKVRAALRFSSIDAEAERVLDSDPWFDGDEAQRKLAVAVAKLPDKQRAVFCMRYFEEMPYEEISAITGTSVGALKASYHQATEKIKASVELAD